MTLRERLLRPGRHWVLVSVAMYVLACMLPAVGSINSENPIRGYVCLISVNGPLVYVYQLPYWWANPIYFVAVIASLFQWPRIAAVFAVVATLLAMSYEWIALYEGGISGVREILLPGCLMWIASIQTLACHELWRIWLDWKRRDYERDVGVGGSAAKDRRSNNCRGRRCQRRFGCWQHPPRCDSYCCAGPKATGNKK